MKLATPASNPVTKPRAAIATDEWRQRVARAFSRAAPRYSELATAQQTMGQALWQRLPDQASHILDMGCGPGHWTARLADHYAASDTQPRVLGLDLAPGMLDKARAEQGEHLDWLCGDAACLPLADQRLDLVFSNLAIQWCPDVNAVFTEVYRVLQPGGRALINTLGPGTLGEVGWAWSRPNALLNFQTPQILEQAALRAGFTEIALEQAQERFHYADLTAVMASIKGVGAQLSRPTACLTKRDLAHAKQRYEQLREIQGLPVTYQRLMIELIKT
ncbi:methyltransferase domain-containing protein [Onishia niordana]|uniref:methyltransferase domain-containing protein n=1 Tax=Onishia niordana TaxID=2508711 RepID=UPI001F0E7D46|nr:methyltransferase domain-containing protein [Halomonas niordiana]